MGSGEKQMNAEQLSGLIGGFSFLTLMVVFLNMVICHFFGRPMIIKMEIGKSGTADTTPDR